MLTNPISLILIIVAVVLITRRLKKEKADRKADQSSEPPNTD